MSRSPLEQHLGQDPWKAFNRWIQDAQKTGLPNPNAMCLSTVGAENMPTSRIVLLKKWSQFKGFVFYTNYNSRKGRELTANPQASALLFWDVLQRQIKIDGRVEKTTKEDSQEYFMSRPLEHQIGAYASKQSQVIPNRQHLDERIKHYTAMFHEQTLNCPDFWGGFRIIPSIIEFWQGQPYRTHDRVQFLFDEEGKLIDTNILAP